MKWVSDSYQMALPEGMKVQASYLTTILAEEGPAPPKKIIVESKFVLKCFLDNISQQEIQGPTCP